MNTPETPPVKTVICAWCNPGYKPKPGEYVTHGICSAHKEEMEREAIRQATERRGRL